jgi:putative ABC transport system permease protein
VNQGAPRPPALGRWLLRLAARADRVDSEADLVELFHLRLHAHGRAYARRRFVLDALSVVTRTHPHTVRDSSTRGVRLRMASMIEDIRFALRLFRRQAGVMSLAVAGLALAIGVNTAAFTFVNALQLRPLGVPEPERIVHVHQAYGPQGVRFVWDYSDVMRLRDQARSMRAEPWLNAWIRITSSAASADLEAARAVPAALIGGAFFETFGGRARLGRLIGPQDDHAAAPPVAVLSYVYWRSRFGADPTVVGRTVFLSGVPATVVGVMDPAFTGPFENPPVIWQPLGSAHHVVPWVEAVSPASRQPVNVIAKLVDPSALERAGAEASQVIVALRALRPSAPADDRGPTGARLRAASLEGDAGISVLVLGIVGLVVLLACTNVANLLLASATSRQHEIAARLALGASRVRVARQLLTESLLLSLSAGALGLAIAIWMVPIIAGLVQVPPGLDVTPDLRVFAFTGLLSLIAGVGAGLAPARFGARGDLLTPLKGGARDPGYRPNRTRAIFVGVQAMASMLLLVLAALFGRAAMHTTWMDLGFDPSTLMAGQPRPTSTDPQGARTAAFLENALARAESLPHVEAAAVALFQPLGGGYMPLSLPADLGHLAVHENRTSAGYFRALGLKTLRGHTYSAADVRTRKLVAVISQRLAVDLWGEADAIGRTLERLQAAPQRGMPDLASFRVIGVVSDAISSRLNQAEARQVYLPLQDGDAAAAAHLLIRTREPAATVARSVQQALQAVDQDVRLSWTLTSDHLDRSLARIRMFSTLTGILGALALGLAAVGLFGVASFAASQRLAEMSVRIAIGATDRDIRRLLLRDNLRPVMLGLVAGLGTALLGGQFLAGVLYGISPRDPLAMSVAVGVLASAATLAVLIPARRAARVDPARLLRGF